MTAAVLVAALPSLGGPGIAVAEADSVCPWPSVKSFVATADRVAVVRVVGTSRDHGDGLPLRFTVRTVDDLLGRVPPRMSFRAPGVSHDEAGAECAPAVLDVKVGDWLILAMGQGPDRVWGRLSGVAFLSRDPEASEPFLAEPGLERTTVPRVRALLAARAAAPSSVPAPSASPAPTEPAAPVPSSSPAPSSSPFPGPTLPPRPSASAAFTPSGPPDATATRDGLVVRLWLSAKEAAPGELVEAVVRITNTGADAAFGATGPCLARPLLWSDLSAVVAPGDVQAGNAAAFKQLLVDDASVTTAAWERDAARQLRPGAGVTVRALADCGPTGATYDRVGPHRTLEQRWSWYPTDPLDRGDVPQRPLPPGQAPVTFTWLDAGRGGRPEHRPSRRPDVPITVTADVTLTGDDPGLLSTLELADRALADPAFRAWVDEDPTRRSWDHADARWWPASGDTTSAPLPDLPARAPHGAIEIWLARTVSSSGVVGSAWLDPWTGEVLGFTKTS
ncbi:MAG: hypothetical protein U0869_11310 [Chloroflexota bacterium]